MALGVLFPIGDREALIHSTSSFAEQTHDEREIQSVEEHSGQSADRLVSGVGNSQERKERKKESITIHAPPVRSQAGWLRSMMQGMRWKLFGHCCWFTGRSGKGRRNNCIYIAVPHAPRKLKHRPAGVYA
jgi:hypothetical protein